MKLYPAIYPGDSILQPGKFPGGDALSSWNAAAFGALFVRGNTVVERTPDSFIDLIGIEQRARAARSAWIGGKMKAFYAAVARRF